MNRISWKAGAGAFSLFVAGAMGASPPASAQAARTVLGVVGGVVDNEQRWSRPSETGRVKGALIGGFVIAPTGAGWLSIRLEGLYTQRGGDLLVNEGDEELRGAVRADYFTVSVHPRVSIPLGPVGLHVAAGPTFDQLVRSRLDPGLAQVLVDGSPTVFGVGAGIGVGGYIRDRVYAEVEARVFDGLGDAYSGAFISFRNRSVEVVGRLGVPWSRN